MRLNQYIAASTSLSRRAADQAIEQGRVTVNGQPAKLGQQIQPSDVVTLGGQPVTPAVVSQTIVLNKPVGYVVSRNGQGSPTVYDLLPTKLRHLKPVGRLDKDSSGLLMMTSDGQLAQQLTHPSYQKAKVYQITLNKPLKPRNRQQIEEGVTLDDGPSRMQLSGQGTQWTVTMHEGRNRQIRRTFDQLGYTVTKLHRTEFGDYKLGTLPSGKYSENVVK